MTLFENSMKEKMKANQNKDDCCQQKVEIVILQQVSVISLLLQILAAIDYDQYSRIKI